MDLATDKIHAASQTCRSCFSLAGGPRLEEDSIHIVHLTHEQHQPAPRAPAANPVKRKPVPKTVTTSLTRAARHADIKRKPLPLAADNHPPPPLDRHPAFRSNFVLPAQSETPPTSSPPRGSGQSVGLRAEGPSDRRPHPEIYRRRLRRTIHKSVNVLRGEFLAGQTGAEAQEGNGGMVLTMREFAKEVRREDSVLGQDGVLCGDRNVDDYDQSMGTEDRTESGRWTRRRASRAWWEFE